MVTIRHADYPERLHYDIENQVWYEPLADGTLRAGLTPFAVGFAGEILVFTPKRVGRDFEKGRGFATLEGGKWVGSVRAAFDGVVVAVNEALIERPRLLVEDAFGAGWMLVVRPAAEDWRAGLVTGPAIADVLEAWFSVAEQAPPPE